MTRRERHPVLRKIASRRWRIQGASQSALQAEHSPRQPNLTDHPPRGMVILGKRVLTDRETEVLYHVARGATDQEIADRLYLSRRTVSSHVSNILGKLAVANRRDAVAAAFRIGLL
jgi:DNA-binding NarL/FixJ family response regulator